jgi:hypothetical protein
MYLWLLVSPEKFLPCKNAPSNLLLRLSRKTSSSAFKSLLPLAVLGHTLDKRFTTTWRARQAALHVLKTTHILRGSFCASREAAH